MKNPEEPKAQETVEDGREAYEAPRLESEELYEVLALVCGKQVGGGTFNCRRFHRNS
jgi:hypothetical protein